MLNDAMLLAVWLPLKWFCDKLCQLHWKLFNISQNVVALIFGALTFYFSVLEISYIVLDPSTSMSTKIRRITFKLLVTIISVIAIYLNFTQKYTLTNGKFVSNTPLDIILKISAGFFWLAATMGIFIVTPIVKHRLGVPTSNWYFNVTIGLLYTDSDNNDGETIPSKLINKLKSKRSAPVTT